MVFIYLFPSDVLTSDVLLMFNTLYSSILRLLVAETAQTYFIRDKTVEIVFTYDHSNKFCHWATKSLSNLIHSMFGRLRILIVLTSTTHFGPKRKQKR